jgi:integrase
MDISQKLAEVNSRLKSAAIPVGVTYNGRLGLRATLPLKTGKGLKQQRISLSLPPNAEGFKVAERRAHELAGEIANGSFTWAKWQRVKAQKPDEMLVSELIVLFKAHRLKTTKVSDRTWEDLWEPLFNKLPQSETLSELALRAVALTKKPDTESRKRACQRLQALADYAGLAVDLTALAGDYGYGSVKARSLPSDELIIEWRDRIPNPRWQWVYGMIATFGLRPHEVWACEFIDPHTLKIANDTKTGEHIARAVFPEWSDLWNLIDVKRPEVTQPGNRTKRQFQRYEIPFPAYNLRHAYAFRCDVTCGVEPSISSRWMGHSLTTHQRIYKRWVTEALDQREYDSKVRRNQPE